MHKSTRKTGCCAVSAEAEADARKWSENCCWSCQMRSVQAAGYEFRVVPTRDDVGTSPSISSNSYFKNWGIGAGCSNATRSTIQKKGRSWSGARGTRKEAFISSGATVEGHRDVVWASHRWMDYAPRILKCPKRAREHTSTREKFLSNHFKEWDSA